MSELNEIWTAINQRMENQKEQLEFLFRENEMLSKQNRKLQTENKMLRDDLFELSQEYQKLK